MRVQTHNSGHLAAGGKREKVRSAVGCHCNVLQLGLECCASSVFEVGVPSKVVGTADSLVLDLTCCSCPASGRVDVRNFADWMLVAESDRCAANVRSLMTCSMELGPVAYTATETEGNYCTGVVEVGRHPGEFHSYCNSVLLRLGHWAVPLGWKDTWTIAVLAIDSLPSCAGYRCARDGLLACGRNSEQR